MEFVAQRPLPSALAPLRDLAADLRWTWSHEADHIWRRLDPEGWASSENPWRLLGEVPQEALERFAADPEAVGELTRLAQERQEYLTSASWFANAHATDGLRGIAYFSMEFALGEALRLYAGGLGVLAGDYLKTASDLGVPAVGIGLLYHEGYVRQTIGADANQVDWFVYNDPASLPITPVIANDGQWLRVTLALPGRPLYIRVWQAIVGRTRLYLLDTDDPLNTPADRDITAKLYEGNPEVRFLQEVVLGLGGWRTVEALSLPIDVCHLNEGHAALVVLERARSFMARTKLSFEEALWATRAGNVFTTHSASPDAFDRYTPRFSEQHLPYLEAFRVQLGVPLSHMLALGRGNPTDEGEPFNLGYLAVRGSISTNGVSALHANVSQGVFQALYPQWPRREVPVTHITNGVHAPTWDSPVADAVWEQRCGKARWLGDLRGLSSAMARVTDDDLWSMRNENRRRLVDVVRRRLVRQLEQRGSGQDAIALAKTVLDDGALTLAFARRFTSYKRPTLLLSQRDRLIRLLTDPVHPVQLLIAGKAHPDDHEGKAMIQRWVAFAQDPRVRRHVVFLEDYDLALGQDLVRGADVWLNTPRRPSEACGTSGMKVLVNGGLNLSELDGWWAEAFSPNVGWALSDRTGRDDAESDTREADQLLTLLEREVVPAFAARDARGIPAGWLARVRASMTELAPRFSSSNRMVREYVDDIYIDAATMLRGRTADGATVAREAAAWARRLRAAWSKLRFDVPEARPERDGLRFSVSLDLAGLAPDDVQVQLYADAVGDQPVLCVPMSPGAGVSRELTRYSAFVRTARPASHFTPRVIPYHTSARLPGELPLIMWERRPATRPEARPVLAGAAISD